LAISIKIEKKMLKVKIKRRKKIVGTFFALILGFTYIYHGFGALIILALFLYVGYNYEDIREKVKKIIANRMNDE
jgi:uncharacterized membrane protein